MIYWTKKWPRIFFHQRPSAQRCVLTFGAHKPVSSGSTKKNRLSIGHARVVTSIIESIYLCEKWCTFMCTYTKACIKYIIQNLCWLHYSIKLMEPSIKLTTSLVNSIRWKAFRMRTENPMFGKPPSYVTFFNMYYNKYSKDIASYIEHSAAFSPYCWEHVVYINCSEVQNKSRKQFVYTTCSQNVLSLQFSCTELVIQWTICRQFLWPS